MIDPVRGVSSGQNSAVYRWHLHRIGMAEAAARRNALPGSPEALEAATEPKLPDAEQLSETGETELTTDSREPSSKSGDKQGADKSTDNLSQEERDQVQKLKARDAEVRAHEAAHMAAGGAAASSATYTYQRGPDGVMYAIGGEVSIDMSTSSSNPQATIAKMQQVKAAAMAPGDPSAADHAVAAAATQAESAARAQLAEQTQAVNKSTDSTA